MSIAKQSSTLTRDARGIWTLTSSASLSYPEDGNKECFALEDASFWFKHRNECILSAIKRFPPPGPVLDVGGGNGYVTRYLIDNGFASTLLEPGPVGALNAKTHRDIPEVICATIQDAAFPENSIAAVGLFDVLEHIEEDKVFLRDIHRILSADGLLYMTVPAHAFLWSSSDVTAGHYRRYDASLIHKLLHPSFECLAFTYFFSALYIPLLLLRTLPFRLGLMKNRTVLSAEAEHGSTAGPFSRLLASMLGREPGRITRGSKIVNGTSCLVVARSMPRSSDTASS